MVTDDRAGQLPTAWREQDVVALLVQCDKSGLFQRLRLAGHFIKRFVPTLGQLLERNTFLRLGVTAFQNLKHRLESILPLYPL